MQQFDRWKNEFNPTDFDRRCGYDSDLLEAEKSKLEDAIIDDDVGSLSQFLESYFSRNIAGVNHPQLYAHSHHGTKTLVDEYTATVIAALSLVKTPAILGQTSESELYKRIHVLQTALKHYGRTALTLSGGATMGMKHIGVVKALLEADLLPHIVSGTSAGSIVAAVTCCTPDEGLLKVLDRFSDGDMAVFSDKNDSVTTRCVDAAFSMCAKGALFDECHLTRVMRLWLTDLTFMQAYNLTGRKLCIGISPDDGQQPRLLSYLNAPNVLVWSAVVASCAVPSVFSPAHLYERCSKTGQIVVWKEPGTDSKWIDGSVDADIPKEQLAAAFGVKNFIVSQVNPHVRLFTGEKQFTGKEKIVFDDGQPRNIREASLNYLRSLIIGQGPPSWTIQQPDEWRLVRMIKSILRQEYWGDINIFPALRLREVSEIFANPTPEFMQRATRCGERATWPRLSQIRNSYAIELALVRTIRELKSHAHFGEQIVRTSDTDATPYNSRGRTEPSLGTAVWRRRTTSLGRKDRPAISKHPPQRAFRRHHLRRRSSSSLNCQAIVDFLEPLTVTDSIVLKKEKENEVSARLENDCQEVNLEASRPTSPVRATSALLEVDFTTSQIR